MAGNITDRLGISAEQLQNAKLGPGVVGRNSRIAISFLAVALAGVGAGISVHSPFIVGLSVSFGFISAVVITVLNVIFGHKNPGAAILEGAEFIQYQQIMASKGNPVIHPVLPVEPKPPELSGGDPGTAEGGALSE
jgi:hypothetical protein